MVLSPSLSKGPALSALIWPFMVWTPGSRVENGPGFVLEWPPSRLPCVLLLFSDDPQAAPGPFSGLTFNSFMGNMNMLLIFLHYVPSFSLSSPNLLKMAASWIDTSPSNPLRWSIFLLSHSGGPQCVVGISNKCTVQSFLSRLFRESNSTALSIAFLCCFWDSRCLSE